VTREVGRVRVIVATLELIALTVRVSLHVHPTVFASTDYATAPEAIPVPLAILLCVRTIVPITGNAYLLESVWEVINQMQWEFVLKLLLKNKKLTDLQK
jgi:hypothetical protein